MQRVKTNLVGTQSFSTMYPQYEFWSKTKLMHDKTIMFYIMRPAMTQISLI